jgi:O-methyltransferase involved in polyketide biosynthesis
VHLTEERATLLGTLYGRALDARSENPILRDAFAADLIPRIDYDFRKLGIGNDDAVGVAMRARLLDRWTAAFIDRYPDATVLHLGCGLDSRGFRVDPPPSVRWFEVDYPDVIELRRRLYPTRAAHRLIGSSVTDERWLDEVAAGTSVMIVAEGLLMYLQEQAVRDLADSRGQRNTRSFR